MSRASSLIPVIIELDRIEEQDSVMSRGIWGLMVNMHDKSVVRRSRFYFKL